MELEVPLGEPRQERDFGPWAHFLGLLSPDGDGGEAEADLLTSLRVTGDKVTGARAVSLSSPGGDGSAARLPQRTRAAIPNPGSLSLPRHGNGTRSSFQLSTTPSARTVNDVVDVVRASFDM